MRCACRSSPISFGLLVLALWLNRSQPGLLLAMVGVGANGLAILVNAGFMPVFVPAVEVAGLTSADLSPAFHVALPTDLGIEFLLKAGPLGDVLPIVLRDRRQRHQPWRRAPRGRYRLVPVLGHRARHVKC